MFRSFLKDNIKEHHEEKSTSSTLSVLAEPFFSSYFKESSEFYIFLL